MVAIREEVFDPWPEDTEAATDSVFHPMRPRYLNVPVVDASTRTMWRGSVHSLEEVLAAIDAEEHRETQLWGVLAGKYGWNVIAAGESRAVCDWRYEIWVPDANDPRPNTLQRRAELVDDLVRILPTAVAEGYVVSQAGAHTDRTVLVNPNYRP